LVFFASFLDSYGRGMEKLGILLAGILIPFNCCMAGEVEDAVELLSEALKCPNKFDWREESGDVHVFHIINRFVGDTKTLRIQINIRFDSGAEVTRFISAKFADLYPNGGVFTDSIRHKQYINLNCAIDGCVTYFTTQLYGDAFVPYPLEDEDGASPTTVVCDEDNANFVKLAVDTLIRLNTTGDVSPQAQPATNASATKSEQTNTAPQSQSVPDASATKSEQTKIAPQAPGTAKASTTKSERKRRTMARQPPKPEDEFDTIEPTVPRSGSK
jgi:hypothetical protein